MASISQEQQLWQFLCLLDAPQYAAKQNVQLAPTTFSTSNIKAFGLVVTKLYTCIHGEKNAKDVKAFVNPDGTLSKDCFKFVADWTKELRDNFGVDGLQAIPQSTLKTPHGPKIISWLLDVATLAVHIQLAQIDRFRADAIKLRQPPLDKSIDTKTQQVIDLATRDLAAAACHDEYQKFLQLTKAAADHEVAMRQAADTLSHQFYAAKARSQKAKSAPMQAGLAQDVRLGASQDQNNNLWNALLSEDTPLPDLSGQTAAMNMPAEIAQQLPVISALDQHLTQYDDVKRLLDDTVGAAVHPYAIDGAALRKLRDTTKPEHILPDLAATTSGDASVDGSVQDSQQRLPGVAGLTCPDLFTSLGSTNVDIVQLLDGFVSGLEDVAHALHNIVTPPGDNQLPRDAGGNDVQQQKAPAVHPLLADLRDPSGHAALLATQLKAHQDCSTGLQALMVHTRAQIAEADALIHDLEPKVMEPIKTSVSMQKTSPYSKKPLNITASSTAAFQSGAVGTAKNAAGHSRHSMSAFQEAPSALPFNLGAASSAGRNSISGVNFASQSSAVSLLRTQSLEHQKMQDQAQQQQQQQQRPSHGRSSSTGNALPPKSSSVGGSSGILSTTPSMQAVNTSNASGVPSSQAPNQYAGFPGQTPSILASQSSLGLRSHGSTSERTSDAGDMLQSSYSQLSEQATRVLQHGVYQPEPSTQISCGRDSGAHHEHGLNHMMGWKAASNGLYQRDFDPTDPTRLDPTQAFMPTIDDSAMIDMETPC